MVSAAEETILQERTCGNSVGMTYGMNHTNWTWIITNFYKLSAWLLQCVIQIYKSYNMILFITLKSMFVQKKLILGYIW